jgi:hypothetical protein
MFPYNRTSEYNRSLLSIGRGIGKPGRIGDPVERFRPLRSDPPGVANRPVDRRRMLGTAAGRRTVADKLRAMQTQERRDPDTRARYTGTGPFIGQAMYRQRQEGART